MFFSEDLDDERVQRAPRIVLMGSRRSGKTSMERVVFGKMSPHETLFVASSASPTLRLVANNDLVQFAILDIPGGSDITDLFHNGQSSRILSLMGSSGVQLTPFSVFSRCIALVYVVDAEADPLEECAKLAEVVAVARKVNPRLALEVFVHKVDGDAFLTEEQKVECKRTIEACARAELELRRASVKDNAPEEEEKGSSDDGQGSDDVKQQKKKKAPGDASSASMGSSSSSYSSATMKNQTKSQKQKNHAAAKKPPRGGGGLPSPPAGKNNSNKYAPNNNKTHAGGGGPTLEEDVERINCSLTSIYDHSVYEAFSKVIQRLVPSKPALERMLDALVAACDMEKAFLFDVSSKVYIATDSAPVDPSTYELCADAIDVVLDVSSIYTTPPPHGAAATSPHHHIDDAVAAPSVATGAAPRPSNAASVTLSNGISLVLDEIDSSLALVCIIRSEALEKRPLIDFNLASFRDALRKIAQLGH